MYHSRFKGSHYDAGYKYGNIIYNKGVKFEDFLKLDFIKFTQEKINFGKKCIVECQRVYPEILEEIKGTADGMKADFEDLASFIFCIYCFQYNNWCTCFAFKDKNNIVLGRNSDFLIKIKKGYESTFYNLDNSYSFIGNNTAMIQMEDGVNIHGLAVGLTFIFPTVLKPGLNAGLLVRYILEKCRTVREAVGHLKKMPISSSQTLTMIDKTGDMALVECNCEKVTAIIPKNDENFLVITNRFTTNEMQKYICEGLVDDIHSEDRYITAKNALKNAKNYSVKFAKDVLSGRYGFMCQYDRKLGFDTVWSSVYDLKNKKIYRSEGNPSRVRYKEDKRLKIN